MIIRDYLICLLQMYLLEDLEKNILPYRRERFWEKFLVYCIAALAMFGTNRLESSILNMVMIPVIYMIASMVVFRGNIWKKLVTVCCYYVLAIIPEFLFAALTNAYGVTGASEGFRTETEKTLALLLMSTMTFLFIKCINQVTRKRDYLTIENKTFTVLLMLPTATIVMLGCMFYSHTSFEGMNRVMVPVGASLLLMTNIFIFTVFDRFVEKSEEVKKMDRLYQKSRAEIANLQYMNKVNEDNRAFLHDINKFICTVAGLIEEGENQEVKDIMEHLGVRIQNLQKSVYCEHPILNSILCERKFLAESKDISYRITLGNDLRLDFLEELDLISIVGNLLDNALVAYLTKRPVKVKLSRQESITVHPKRHPMWMDITTACDENGYLTAMKAVVVSDTGAYASLGGPVLQRACTHAAGPYNFQTIDIDGKAVYTNNPPAGAFRGFGVTQTCFGAERNLDLLAEMVGISPWEIRYRNAVRPGQVLPNGQIADASTGIAETLEAVKEIYEQAPYAGIACAMKNAGVGVGLPDWGRCRLLVQNKMVQIHAGASCIGQGLGTVLTQVVSQTAQIPVEQIWYCPANTSNSPDSGTTSGSRQTLITGEAAKRACEKLCEDLKTHSLQELEGKEYYGEYLAKTDKMGSDVPNPVSHVAYGYATQVCILNEDGTIQKMVAAHDVGKAVNPISVEGQIEGGVVMGMGYALTEQYEIKEGRPVSRFGTLGLFRADKVPHIESMIIEKTGVEPGYGAIGIGEITSIPTAPAITGAYYKLTGEFQTKLPLHGTPYEKKKK